MASLGRSVISLYEKVCTLQCFSCFVAGRDRDEIPRKVLTVYKKVFETRVKLSLFVVWQTALKNQICYTAVI